MKLSLAVLLFFHFAVEAQLQLPKIFSDNMVLQRGKPVHIWGKAPPGKKIEVQFGSMKLYCKAKTDSSWSVDFAGQKENSTPQSLIIRLGRNKLELKNILIGDVWVCIGQSNMEFPMKKEIHFKESIKDKSQPLLRFYNPWFIGKYIFNESFPDSLACLLYPDEFYRSASWEKCDSNTISEMSAVAYYFGQEIENKTKVPIGLINFSIGGAPLETFISTDVLKKSQLFRTKVNGDWLNNDALPVWIRERGRQNVGNLINVPSDQYGKNHAFKPGFAYSAGIEPILLMAIKGIICYQGESNAQEIERVNEYGRLSELLIDDYRKKWKQPELPFYFVQLSSIDTLKYKGQLWPQFRNEQRKMLKLISHSGMAVCSDIGAKDDVHPTNKKDVGERLARWALHDVYGKDIIPSGPLPLQARYLNDKVIITFRYIGKGLMTSDGKSIRGFSLDGKSPVDAVIGDCGILIFTKYKPEYIYYGWKSFTDGNLVNSEELPASTFKIKVE